VLTKYEKWYWRFIERFYQRGWTKVNTPLYVEGHHPYPVGIFGKKENTWIVYVTPREHYVLHLLLSKFSELRMPMFWNDITSREFSVARLIASKQNRKELHPRYGKKHTKEVVERLKKDPRVRSVAGKVSITDGLTQKFILPSDPIPEGWVRGGVKDSEETREKKRNVDPSVRSVNKGRTFSDEWKNNLKKAKENAPLLECPVCNKICKGKGPLKSHERTHDPKKRLEMSLIAQVREANKNTGKNNLLFP
jgi:hypothetical protein